MSNGGHQHPTGEIIGALAVLVSILSGAGRVISRMVHVAIEHRSARLENAIIKIMDDKFVPRELADARYEDVTARLQRLENQIEQITVRRRP